MNKFVKMSIMLFMTGTVFLFNGVTRSLTLVEVGIRSKIIEVTVKEEGILVKNNRKKVRYEWYRHAANIDNKLVNLISIEPQKVNSLVACYKYKSNCYKKSSWGTLDYMATKLKLDILIGAFFMFSSIVIFCFQWFKRYRQ